MLVLGFKAKFYGFGLAIQMKLCIQVPEFVSSSFVFSLSFV